MTTLRLSLAFFLLIGMATVQAEATPAPTPPVPDETADTEEDNTFAEDYQQVLRLLSAQRYEAAIDNLELLQDDYPDNADVLNLLGYSHRKLKEFEEAHEFYNQALEIEPFHLGANEYLGELYLQTDELEKAQGQLEVLTEACDEAGEEECHALESLTAAIAAYEAGEYDAFMAAQEDDFSNIW